MELKDLNAAERVALVALVHRSVLSDNAVSDNENEDIARLARELGEDSYWAVAEVANAHGVATLAHPATTLAPEYGTLVPMRYMNTDQHFKVLSVSAMCTVHYLNDSARLGWAMRRAVEEHYDGTVAIFASGSLSHRFAQNGLAPEYAFKIWSPFLKHLDREVVRMWEAGEWADFCTMLPEYASKGHGEGFMHDTAMLLGALGWSAYQGRAEVITPYFGASGTGQINVVLPVTPQDGAAVPAAQASAAQGYTNIQQRL
mgnify:CR=1 FL=1